MTRLEVKTRKRHPILAVLIGLFFVPLGLLNLFNGLVRGFAIVPLGIGLMVLIIYAAIIWLVWRGHTKSVKYFSGEGLVRNDGRSFMWADLSRVVNQITRVRYKPNVLWRTEIQFKNGGVAWLIPSKVTNYHEVSEFIHNLSCEHTEVRV